MPTPNSSQALNPPELVRLTHPKNGRGGGQRGSDVVHCCTASRAATSPYKATRLAATRMSQSVSPGTLEEALSEPADKG